MRWSWTTTLFTSSSRLSSSSSWLVCRKHFLRRLPLLNCPPRHGCSWGQRLGLRHSRGTTALPARVVELREIRDYTISDLHLIKSRPHLNSLCDSMLAFCRLRSSMSWLWITLLRRIDAMYSAAFFKICARLACRWMEKLEFLLHSIWFPRSPFRPVTMALLPGGL